MIVEFEGLLQSNDRRMRRSDATLMRFERAAETSQNTQHERFDR